jgi:hypothetical protein
MEMTRWNEWAQLVREANRIIQARGVMEPDIHLIHSAGLYLGALLYVRESPSRLEEQLSDILASMGATRVRP